jgi:hypothetical protein
MWDAITTLIKGLPEWYIMVMLPFLLVGLVWAFSHMRRDKQGKLYWYKESYEKNKQNKKLDLILQEVKHVDLRVLRLEILNNIHDSPDKVDVIMGLYKHYKDVNGNSYVDAVYNAWYQMYAIPAAEGQVG